MSSSNAQKPAETNSSNNGPQPEPEKQTQQNLLGALEEDDEFEEFPVQGTVKDDALLINGNRSLFFSFFDSTGFLRLG